MPKIVAYIFIFIFYIPILLFEIFILMQILIANPIIFLIVLFFEYPFVCMQTKYVISIFKGEPDADIFIMSYIMGLFPIINWTLYDEYCKNNKF